ncbi:phage protein Gp27 family protein [Devosia sp.]|uniref:phage protein Gp27 family protein n=1 Tax=Devosia sp. TaxID=1871048 RepID=UPI001AC19408|nr:phage protein Gp27 family protein [Devosia sp.]MBN9333874.1 DUF3486 family protein [Devosia sp.]
MARPEKERAGRGRLSRLDMLPEVAQPDLVWVNGELREGKRPQNELRDIFNARLAAHGIEPISVGSFSRYSVRKAAQFQQLDEQMRISSELVEVLGIDGSDKMTIAFAELVRVAGIRLLEAKGGELAAKDLMELARANQAASGAMKQSAEYRRSLERDFAEKVAEAAKDVAEIGKVAGITADTMQKITNRLKGIV